MNLLTCILPSRAYAPAWLLLALLFAFGLFDHSLWSSNDTREGAMIRIALDYLRLLNNPQIKFRFDIVEVLLREDAQKPDDIRVITNAFDLHKPFIY